MCSSAERRIMELRRALMIVAALAAFACAPKKEEEKKEEPKGPAPIGEVIFTKPEQKPLTQGMLKDFDKFSKAMNYAGADRHVLPDPSESAEDRQRREESLNNEPAEVKLWVQDMKAQCVLNNPAKTTEGQLSDVVGSSQTESRLASAFGTHCPMTINNMEKNSVTMVTLNRDANYLRMSFSNSSESQKSMKDVIRQNRWDLRDITYSSQSTGEGERTGNVFNFYTQGPIKMSLQNTADYVYNVNGRMEAGIRGGVLMSNIKLDITLPSGNLEMVIQISDSKMIVFLNGHELGQGDSPWTPSTTLSANDMMSILGTSVL